MHTDENKMNFLRRVLNTTPHVTVRQAFALLDAAAESFPVDAPVRRTDGVWHNGVFFSDKAESLMENNQKIAAIKEVRTDNQNDKKYGEFGYFGLKQAKDAVDGRMDFMDYPYRNHR